MRWQKIKNSHPLYDIKRSGLKAIKVPNTNSIAIVGGSLSSYLEPVYTLDIGYLSTLVD